MVTKINKKSDQCFPKVKAGILASVATHSQQKELCEPNENYTKKTKYQHESLR